jgi:hypothetical protein
VLLETPRGFACAVDGAAEPLVVKSAANGGLDLHETVIKTISLVSGFPSATGSLWESFLALAMKRKFDSGEVTLCGDGAGADMLIPE